MLEFYGYAECTGVDTKFDQLCVLFVFVSFFILLFCLFLIQFIDLFVSLWTNIMYNALIHEEFIKNTHSFIGSRKLR